MKKLVWILIYLSGFACCERNYIPEYPVVIENNNLQDLYDKAKWEIYKLNYLVEYEWQTDFVVNFDSDTIFYKFYNVERKYQTDKNEVIKILGKENVIDFLEIELAFAELDSSIMFKNQEILFNSSW